MTVKKAIKILDFWIEQRKEKIKEIPNYKFNDIKLETTLLENEQTIIKNL